MRTGKKALSPSLAAVAILRHVEQARGEVAQVGLEPSGQILVALSKFHGSNSGGQAFCRCNERLPKINLRLLELSVKDSRQRIETREVDFGLLPNAPTLEGGNIFPLIALDLYLIGPQRKRESHSNFVSFKDLHCYPLVIGGKNDQLRMYPSLQCFVGRNSVSFIDRTKYLRAPAYEKHENRLHRRGKSASTYFPVPKPSRNLKWWSDRTLIELSMVPILLLFP